MYLNNSDITAGFDNRTGNEQTSDNHDVDISPVLSEYFFINYCLDFFFYSLFNVAICAIFYHRPQSMRKEERIVVFKGHHC